MRLRECWQKRWRRRVSASLNQKALQHLKQLLICFIVLRTLHPPTTHANRQRNHVPPFHSDSCIKQHHSISSSILFPYHITPHFENISIHITFCSSDDYLDHNHHILDPFEPGIRGGDQGGGQSGFAGRGGGAIRPGAGNAQGRRSRCGLRGYSMV